MDFLRRIEAGPFPMEVRNPADLRSAAVLVAAELIEADLMPPVDGDAERPGYVLRIAPLGKAALAHDCAKKSPLD